MRFRIIIGLCIGAWAAWGIPAGAQDYPTRTAQVIIAFPPGGSADIVGRHVMQKISELSGQSFIVENRTGSGGNIAFSAVANGKSDGYTLLFSTPGIAINPSLYRKVNFKIEDFTPIALIGEAPLVLLINPKIPIHSIKELVDYSKANPEILRFASSGNGSSSHLAMDVLRANSGMKYTHIPYRGGGPAMLDTIAGRVDVTMLPIAESMPYVRDGRLRSLGQTGSKRSAIAPDMPTIEEGGLPGYSSTTWYMLLGPANLPPQVVKTLQALVENALKAPDLKDRLQAAGVTLINGNAAQATQFLHAENKKWAKIIQASGTILE